MSRMNSMTVVQNQVWAETAAQMFWRHLRQVRHERLLREGWRFDPSSIQNVVAPDGFRFSVSFEDDEQCVRELDKSEWDWIWTAKKRKEKIAKRADWNSVIQRKGCTVVFDMAKYKQARKDGRLP